MKRLVCLLLVVLLVAAMTVPAWAVVERPDLRVMVLDAYEIALSRLGSARREEYPYYASFFSVDSNGDANVFNFFFFNQQSSLTGSKVCMIRILPSGSISYAGYDFPFISTSYSNGFLVRYLLNGNNTSLKSNFMIQDFSTVDFSNFDFEEASDAYVNIMGYYVDISSLEALLEESATIQNIGYTSASWSRFQNALQAAMDLLEQSEYTQEQVDSAFDTLLSVKDALVLLPDASELESLLAACKAVSADSYTAISYAALQSAMKQADELLTRPDYTDSDIADMILGLQAARDSLVEMSAQDFVLKEALLSLTESLVSDIAVIIPICICIFAVFMGVRFVPRIFKTFTKS